jgi:hypothetical protein
MPPTDAFILGAGFSIAIAPEVMPTTDELGTKVLDAQRQIHDADQQGQHSPRCDGISCETPFLLNGSWPAPNFEVWLSRLAEEQPYLYSPDNAIRRAMFEKLVGLVGVTVSGLADWLMRGDSPPTWLFDLVGRWMDDEAHVVTLNYDALVEATVDAIVLNHFANHGPPSALQLEPRLIRLDPICDVLPPREQDQVKTRLSLYKLHGSTRWFWDDLTRSTDSMVDVGQTSGWYLNLPSIEVAVPGKVPVIVPPTTTKSGFFSNGIIREIWHGAYRALRGAGRVFVLGYSLPPADLVVQSLLTEAFSVKHPEVWLVNTSESAAENYKHLGVELKTKYCIKREPIKRFVEDYLNGSLDA